MVGEDLMNEAESEVGVFQTWIVFKRQSNHSCDKTWEIQFTVRWASRGLGAICNNGMVTGSGQCTTKNKVSNLKHLQKAWRLSGFSEGLCER